MIPAFISGRILMEYGHFFMPFTEIFFWYKKGNIIQRGERHMRRDYRFAGSRDFAEARINFIEAKRKLKRIDLSLLVLYIPDYREKDGSLVCHSLDGSQKRKKDGTLITRKLILKDGGRIGKNTILASETWTGEGPFLLDDPELFVLSAEALQKLNRLFGTARKKTLLEEMADLSFRIDNTMEEMPFDIQYEEQDDMKLLTGLRKAGEYFSPCFEEVHRLLTSCGMNLSKAEADGQAIHCLYAAGKNTMDINLSLTGLTAEAMIGGSPFFIRPRSQDEWVRTVKCATMYAKTAA